MKGTPTLIIPLPEKRYVLKVELTRFKLLGWLFTCIIFFPIAILASLYVYVFKVKIKTEIPKI